MPYFLSTLIPRPPRQNRSNKNTIESTNTFQAAKHATCSFWLVWAVIIILYIVIRINIINIPLDRDEGIFGYTGQTILNNGLPYRDVFDHKPPVVFYLNALALLLVPPTSTGIHIFLHTYNFLTLIALFFVARSYTQSNTTGLWVAFLYAIFSSSPVIQGFTASTEMFLLLPMTLSLLFAILAVSKDKIYFSMLSGICGALTVFTKQTGALIILFIICYLLLAQISVNADRDTYIKAIKSLAMWGAGFLLISLLIPGYFYFQGNFDEFIYWNFTHSYIYSKNSHVIDVFPRIHQVIVKIITDNLLIISVGLCVSIVDILRKNAKGYFALGFLFFSLMATVPGAAYSHYFAQIAPAIAIIGGFGISSLIDPLQYTKKRIPILLLCALGIIIVPVWVHSCYYINNSPDQISRGYFGNNPFPESVDLAKFIMRRTNKDDSVFIFGSEAQILLLSQRKSATSYALIYPLMSIFPRYKEFQRKAWEEIASLNPKYIIIVNIPTSLLWDGKADLWILSKTKQLIDENYNLEAVMTIKKPKGELILASETKNFQEIFRKQNFPIYVFRRK